MSNLDQVTEARTVVIAQGVRCVTEDGTVYADGATATVPLALAAAWIRSGWATAEEVSAPASEQQESAPSA